MIEEAPKLLLNTNTTVGYVISSHYDIYHFEYGYDLSFKEFISNSVHDFIEHANRNYEHIWILDFDGDQKGSIGLTRVDDKTAQIRLFLIDPELRGHGYGHQLVQCAIDFARSKNYSDVILWTNSDLQSARQSLSLSFVRWATMPIPHCGHRRMPVSGKLPWKIRGDLPPFFAYRARTRSHNSCEMMGSCSLCLHHAKPQPTIVEKHGLSCAIWVLSLYNKDISFVFRGGSFMSATVNRLVEEFKRLSDEEKREMIEKLEAEDFYRQVLQYSFRDWDNAKDDAYNDL